MVIAPVVWQIGLRLEIVLFVTNGLRLMVTTSGMGACVLINSLFGLAMRHYQVFEYERHKNNQRT